MKPRPKSANIRLRRCTRRDVTDVAEVISDPWPTCRLNPLHSVRIASPNYIQQASQILLYSCSPAFSFFSIHFSILSIGKTIANFKSRYKIDFPRAGICTSSVAPRCIPRFSDSPPVLRNAPFLQFHFVALCIFCACSPCTRH